MPVYEYECVKCGQHTEILQKISDPPITKCELCNGKMKKLISQSTFHLKGSGWYVTDYASKTGGYDGRTGNSDSGSTPKESAMETKGASDSTQANASSTNEKKPKGKD